MVEDGEEEGSPCRPGADHQGKQNNQDELWSEDIPYDDRFILRSTILRDDLLAFYLRNVVTSSLDYHFILMTLNQIEDLRSQYIRAYQSQTQAVMEV